MKSYVVYKHVFPNDKVYIGVTCQKVEHRWRSDGSGYRPRKENTSRIWNAIRKYGWENVQHEILFTGLSKLEAEIKEIELIALYNSSDKRFGYNIGIGGNLNTISDETRKKIGQSRKNKNYDMVGENAPMYGKHHSEETKQRIQKHMTGERNPMYGKHHTPDTIQKLRDNHSNESKSICQIDECGCIVATFSSIHLAAKITGINRQCISFCLQKKYKKAGGYTWNYI